MKKALRVCHCGASRTSLRNTLDMSRAIRAGRQLDLLQLDQWKKELSANR